MSPRLPVPAVRRELGLLAAAFVACAAVAAAPATAGAAPAAAIPVASSTATSTPDPADISRVLTTGSDAEAAALLGRLGLDPGLATRATGADAGLASLLSVLESLRQTLAPTKLPLIGATLDDILRTVIDSLATRAGIDSPAEDSVLTPPVPTVLFPGVPASDGSGPATPAPVAAPVIRRATVVRIRTTGSRTRLRIAATCPASSSVACRSVVVGTLGGRRAFTSRRLTIDPGATREATVALSRAAARTLSRSSATVRVATTTQGATPATVSRKSLRVPRAR